MNKIENIKTKITDASYIDLMNNLAKIKEENDSHKHRIHRLKKKAYKIHYQLMAVTDWAVAQEWEDEEGELVFLESF